MPSLQMNSRISTGTTHLVLHRQTAWTSRVGHGVFAVSYKGRKTDRTCVVYAEDANGVPDEETSSSSSAPQGSGDAQYIDELPEVPRSEISPEMKERLKREYYGLGGSPNRPMGGNYFLYIILGISVLALLSSSLGYL